MLETHGCPLPGLTNQEGLWNSEVEVVVRTRIRATSPTTSSGNEAQAVGVVVEAVVQSLNGQPGPNGRSDMEFRQPLAFLQEPMLNLKKKAI